MKATRVVLLCLLIAFLCLASVQAWAWIRIDGVSIAGPTTIACGGQQEYSVAIWGYWNGAGEDYIVWGVWDKDPKEGPDKGNDHLSFGGQLKLTGAGNFMVQDKFTLYCKTQILWGDSGHTHGSKGDVFVEAVGDEPPGGKRSNVLVVKCVQKKKKSGGNVRSSVGCEIPAYDTILSQSGWHKLRGQWAVSSYGQWSDGAMSEVIGYPFGVSSDSVVQDVYVGGGFEYFEGQELPDTCTLDIYQVADYAECGREPFAAGCCDPGPLIARYIFNTEEIWPTEWSDLEGCLYSAFTSPNFYEKVKLALEPPLPLEAGTNYFLAFYANVRPDQGEAARFNMTIDMLSGRDQVCISGDAGASWFCWEWFGGELASGIDLELRGEVLDRNCPCNIPDEAELDTLYDQTQRHNHTQQMVWAGLSYGAAWPTGILGQPFNYDVDGQLERVGLGGTFGMFGDPPHEIPEHLIVELWCMEQQEGMAEPVTLLRRWMVPTEELVETFDPQGYPVQSFFCCHYPGPYEWCDTIAPGGSVWVTNDRPFMLVAYSDGDENAPFEWFTDMSRGYCRFSGSEDCESTWVHGYYWGPPEPPECAPESNFSFALCGGCLNTEWVEDGELEWSGYLAGPLFGEPESGYPGWVWFSIPNDPGGCCEAEDCYDPNTLLGFECDGCLYKWDKYGKSPQVYKPPFVVWDLEVGDSYLYRMEGPVNQPSYSGLDPYVGARPTVDREGRAKGNPSEYGFDYPFQLGKMGWTWVGLPGESPIRGGATGGSEFGTYVKVKYPADASGAVRTADEDADAVPNNWVQWGWAYHDTFLQAPKTFKFNAPFGNADCYPWIGYRVWVNVGSADEPYHPGLAGNEDQVVLVWPGPGCYASR